MFDPWTCLYIDRLLLENAFRTIQRIPSSIVEDRLSNPYLERTYPDLRQRWDTRGAARLRRQIFPALQIVDIIPVLREALGVSESYLAHTPTADLPEHGRNYTRGVTEFFEAFISANSKHALPSDSGPKRDGRFGLSSNDTPSFIVFRFPRTSTGFKVCILTFCSRVQAEMDGSLTKKRPWGQSLWPGSGVSTAKEKTSSR